MVEEQVSETERIDLARKQYVSETELRERTMGINRIPPETKKRFLAFCDEHYESDRGMALKGLMDFYDNRTSFDYVMDRVQLVEEQLSLLLGLLKLEVKPQVPVPDEIKNFYGRKT